MELVAPAKAGAASKVGHQDDRQAPAFAGATNS